MVTSEAGHVSQSVQAEKELSKPPYIQSSIIMLPRLHSLSKRNTLPQWEKATYISLEKYGRKLL